MKTLFTLITGFVLNMPSSHALAQKIQATGKYLPFPGITNVSHVESSKLATRETFYHELTKFLDFTYYFALFSRKKLSHDDCESQ